LLKYYHPVVSKGKIDWDTEFTSKIKSLSSIQYKEQLNNFYLDWITSLGSVKECSRCKEADTTLMKLNFDLHWIDDTLIYTSQLSAKLQQIVKNRNTGRKYYVRKTLLGGFTNFKNEKPYKDSIFPSQEFRLLSLARYWNIVNYFFPYKYATDEPWSNVLEEMIPKFIGPAAASMPAFVDTVIYHLAILELVAKTNDSHAGLYTRYTNRYFGFLWPPFQFKIIDDKAIVTDFYNDSLSRVDDIQYGDVITKVNGMDVGDIIRKRSKYIPASNPSALRRDFYYAIFHGMTDTAQITFERNGIVSEKTIHRYKWNKLHFKWSDEKNTGQPYKMLDNENIGYVNMGTLHVKDVNKMMKTFKNTTGIIFDIRNYPNGTMFKLARHLNNKKVPFVKFTVQDLSYPGYFKKTKPYYCGKNQKNNYKGKVMLLINEETQSHAEFTCMALQTAPNVTSIGSQTAGADGNVIVVTFPGGIQTWMTGLGVYYPDGRETQRVGIIPDIEVKPTIEGIRNHRDEVLEKAVEVIHKTQ
jgi:C-terminal processing protease CtpA/Prc